MAQAKLPSFQFYPGDWMKDPALRSVSLPARGLWIDMLCLMHEGDRRGHLQHSTGQPVTADQLARMTGCSTDEVSRLLQELEHSGVFSRTTHGVIFSRRVLRDEHLRQVRSRAGSQGGKKNASRISVLLEQNRSKPQANGEAKSGSSSSSSTSVIKRAALSSPPPQTATGDPREGQIEEKPYRGRVLTAEQQQKRLEFSDWWRCCAWPKKNNGVEYGFEQVDAVKVLECLRHPQIRWDVEKLKQIALAYLDEPELYGLHGYPLTKFRQRLNYLAGKYAIRQREGVGHVLTKSFHKPGEFADNVPLGLGTYSRQGGGAAKAG